MILVSLEYPFCMFSFAQRIQRIRGAESDIVIPVLINNHKNKEDEILHYFRTAPLSELDRIALACPSIYLFSVELATKIYEIRGYRGSKISMWISTTPRKKYTRAEQSMFDEDRKIRLTDPVFYTDCTFETDHIIAESKALESII